jgi:hypothetical protein
MTRATLTPDKKSAFRVEYEYDLNHERKGNKEARF